MNNAKQNQKPKPTLHIKTRTDIANQNQNQHCKLEPETTLQLIKANIQFRAFRYMTGLNQTSE